MRHKNFTICVRVAWVIAAVGIGGTALAQSFLPRGDGWYMWRIDAVADAPYRCCFYWEDNDPRQKVCDIDSRRSSFGSMIDGDSSSGQARVYVRVKQGQVEKVRALSNDCPVKTRSPIIKLDDVSASQSLGLLEDLMRNEDVEPHETLGAIAMHASREAGQSLVTFARHDQRRHVRKAAIFHMGQLRSVDTGRELAQILFQEPDAKLREHAAFSVSESHLVDRDDLLIRLANDDQDASVRAKAWFWLAQTGSEKTEAAIMAAMRAETATKTRHEAIFALAQLPEERAARALINIVEAPDFETRDRKQALFWLAQGESDAGLDYLSRVLARDDQDPAGR